MKERFWIFPVFLPNLGCPHRCTFCDQHVVTGVPGKGPSVELLEALFRKVRFSGKNGDKRGLIRQIAFYGGNFTGISQEVQRRYLEWASEKVRDGLVHSIRFSTRPDALQEEELSFLGDYPIRTVEIGVQSMNDRVLETVHRGHTVETCEKAVNAVLSKGWEAGIQLMPGLPGETLKGFLEGVRIVTEWGIRYVRLYPAVVLKGTQMAKEYEMGWYQPLSIPEAIEWCALANDILEKSGIEVIRVGLPASEGLKSSIVAGPYHPAFGFLVQSYRFHERLWAGLESLPESAHTIRIRISSNDVPLVKGEQGKAWETLKKAFPHRILSYTTDPALERGKIVLENSEEFRVV